ncbi:MAG: DUF2339 domain-containing protein [Terracidiphilus sp.]|jgi:uncharacterized membrane protein
MEFFFIIILAIAVFVIWLRNNDATSTLRDEIARLEREIDFLKSQLSALVKAQAASASSRPPVAPPTVAPIETHPPPPRPNQPEAIPPPVPRQEPPPAAPALAAPPPAPTPATAAQHAPPPAVAAFRPSPPPPVAAQPPAIPPFPPRVPAPQQVPAIPKPAIEAPKPPTPAPLPADLDAKAAARERVFSLEQTLGAKWLNKLGIAILVIGLAFFLAVKLQTWGPGGKVLCGFAVSVALLVGGVWLERKPTYRIFARGAIGGGWALAFFTTYAMHHITAAHVLESLAADLVLMLLVAAGMVGHSLRYRSQTVTGLAFMLGFVTLLTSHLESADGTVVFSLAASVVLAVALVIVTAQRHWAWLEFAGLIAVYLCHLTWLTQVLPENHAAFTEFWPSTALILLYWLIFRAAYVFRSPLNQNEENISSLSAVFNSIGVLGLLKYQAAHPEWAFWALMALGAIEMALAFQVRSRRRQAFVVLSTIATVLLVSAVPFKFHGVTWPVLWLVQTQILAIAGLRLSEPVFRRLGLLVGVVTGGVLAFHDVVPLLIYRFTFPDPAHHASLTVGLALAATLYWIHAEVYPRRWLQIGENDLEAFALRIISWLGAAAAATALWVAIPDLWLPVGWLALVLTLAFAAHRFRSTRLELQADLLAFGSAAVLAIHHVAPLALFRLDFPDSSSHAAETAVLAIGAAAFWIRSEVFPRALPSLNADDSSQFDLSPWQNFARTVISWFGVSAAAAALWVAMPDLWLPIGWLALLLLLALVSQRLGSATLAIEADALAVLSAIVLAFHHVAPLALFRLDYPDPSHHAAETWVLALAAAAWWIRSEALPRLMPLRTSAAGWGFDVAAWQTLTIPATSWLGAAAAAAALWVVLPASWIVVGWLALVVVLGFAADWIKAQTLALQADFLAVASLPGLFFWDVWTQGWWDHKAPLIAAVALLYAGMRRKTSPSGLPRYVAPIYSWAATLLLSFAAAELSSAVALTPAWVLIGLALFELGRFTRKGFLRWQGYLLIALAFGRYGMNLFDFFGATLSGATTPHFSFTNSLLLELLFLASAGYVLLERTTNRERCTRREYLVGLTADALGTLSIALWFAYRFPSTWVPVRDGEAWVTPIWAGMAAILLALAWLMRRRTFLVQAMALVVAVVARGLVLDLFADTSAANFWHGPLFHLGVTALILIAALPFAYQLRKQDRFPAPTFSLPDEFGHLLRHSEQWFFFAAFGLESITLAAKLSSGHITIAWSLLGLGVFLFALLVGERSFRLAGLVLLLVSVAKILLIDVWRLSPTDRYTTLIVLGLALLAVSFLYTRFSAVIRKFL